MKIGRFTRYPALRDSYDRPSASALSRDRVPTRGAKFESALIAIVDDPGRDVERPQLAQVVSMRRDRPAKKSTRQDALCWLRSPSGGVK